LTGESNCERYSWIFPWCRPEREAPPGTADGDERTKHTRGMGRTSDRNEPAGRDEPVVSLENVTLRLRDRLLLPGTSWRILAGQHWAVLGPNGAGKSTLVGSIAGRVPHVRGTITYHPGRIHREAIGYVSLELQDRLIGQAEFREDADGFAGRTGNGYTAGEALLEGRSFDGADPGTLRRITGLLGIEKLLDRAFRHLSTGEMRKIVIARALLKSPRMLILDEPFAGLDPAAKRNLQSSIHAFMEDGIQVLLVSHRREEILPLISHVIGVREGRVLFQGTRREALSPRNLGILFDGKKQSNPAVAREVPGPAPSRREERPVLVDMKNVSVRYGDVRVLEGLHWAVRAGEHWAVLGPSGSGKSTLMSLISTDNLQAYANDITLFGRRRGTGETAGDIRARIGVVSSELQIRYRGEDTAFDVIASGLFDSIGLYRTMNAGQEGRVRHWISLLGISGIAGRSFAHLSYGERRMVLLARAMVKSPELLILDEPCQGLDRANRGVLLGLIDKIGGRRETTILYVTHFEDEIPRCVDRVLRLGEEPEQGLPVRR